LGARLAPNGALFGKDREARNSFDLNERSLEIGTGYFKPTEEKGFSLMPHAPESLLAEDVKFTNDEGFNSINDQNESRARNF